MAHRVDIHPGCDAELDELRRSDPHEHAAILNADRKLRALGTALGYPHSSAVLGTEESPLRELRPRRGRSRWRVLYVTEPAIVLLALAPESGADRRGFATAVRQASERLTRLSQD